MDSQLVRETAAGVAYLVEVTKSQGRDDFLELRDKARTSGIEGGVALGAAVTLLVLAGSLLVAEAEAWPATAALSCIPDGSTGGLLCTPQDNGIASGVRSSSILLVVGALFSGIGSLAGLAIGKLVGAWRWKVAAAEQAAKASAPA